MTDDNCYLSAPRVRQRYGGVSDMWLHRRLRNDPTFPRPVYFGRLRFWRLAELVAWERARAAAPRPAQAGAAVRRAVAA